MTSLRARFYKWVLRRNIRNAILPGGLEGVKMARARAEAGGALGPLMRRKSPAHPVMVDGMEAEWVGNPHATHTLLYLHGGGYFLGSPRTHRGLVRQICRYANLRALVLDYRLAPENPFPAAVDDAEKAYDWLVAQGVAPDTMFVAGDSAGGGLSLALMLRLKAAGKPQPRAAALMSPWTDLKISGASHHQRAARDPMIDVTRIPEAVAFYCGADETPENPLISPLFADLSGLPPLFVQVGTEEVLYDDSTRLVEKVKQAKGRAELQIWNGMPHVHQIAFALVPEARAAIKDIARFFRQSMA